MPAFLGTFSCVSLVVIRSFFLGVFGEDVVDSTCVFVGGEVIGDTDRVSRVGRRDDDRHGDCDGVRVVDGLNVSCSWFCGSIG